MTILGRILGVVLLVLLAGCGASESLDESPTEPSTQSKTKAADPGLPLCSDVWVAGQELPTTYNGCTEDDGSKHVAASIVCDDGTDFFVYKTAPMFALSGANIGKGGPGDPAYDTAYAECSKQ